MPASLRFLAATLATSAAIVLPMAGQVTAATAAPSRPAAPASPAAVAGLTGRPILLQNNAEFSGYDIGVDAAGTAFVGWIGDSGTGRKIHLCTLPRGATSCRGGIQTISAPGEFGPSSASSLQVLVTPGGLVTLIFFHDAVASENGPNGSEIAIATSRAGGPLSAAHDVATGPSFGELLDAELGPNGTIWAVSTHSGSNVLQVRPGLGSPAVNITAPYQVTIAKLAFTGSTGVLAIQKDGAITVPVSFASERGDHWSGFHVLARTWTAAANLGLVKTSAGIRLLASVSNANYSPVVSRWTGSGFSRPALTGDRNNCAPSSHDPVADASGRMVDASEECEDVAIANLTDTLHAAIVRFNVHGTFAGGIPQIVTTPRGRGWVAWSIESTVSNKLLVAPLLLPGRVVIRTARAGRDRVTLHGPASCLPPVNLGIGVTGAPARGSRVTRKVLRLNGRALGSRTLRGGTLIAGRRYTLTGSVTFAGGGTRRVVTAQVTFRSCPGT